MKYLFLSFFIFLSCVQGKANSKDSAIYYSLPDSVKAIQFITAIKIKDVNNSKHFSTGIYTSTGSLLLVKNKGKRGIYARFSEYGKVVALGNEVKTMKPGIFFFEYNWEVEKIYKLMLTIAADSIDKFYLHTAYAFLPDENKWKLIGTVKVPFWKNKLEQLSIRSKSNKKSPGNFIISQAWCQRTNGDWWNLNKDSLPIPVFRLSNHVDSGIQRLTEINMMQDAIASGKTDMTKNKDNVFYTILKEGMGKQVVLTDTVTVFYKGYVFPNGEVFDETDESPIAFPLNRLIKGWQIALPLCKVGAKIKLAILSDMAYSIRTRSPKIPPNSILVFEIEVVEAKSKE